MKKEVMRPWLISTLAFLILSCSESEEISLPYYNSADFTPEWIEEGDDSFAQIHKIADFEFTNQNGNKVSNSTLKGKIYVANFFFTVCPSICPKMTANMEMVFEAFKDDDQIQFLSHTVMPWVDSVSVLKDYAVNKGIDSKKWNLVTGVKEGIYGLARNSYFAEKEIGILKDSNEFLHTENFILVDQEGRIRGVYNGTLQLEMKRLSQDLMTLKKLG